ncbi:MAG TPA: tetratricopeptide repeat protein [Chitinophagaceae bacterium]|nr:tetratricopeptide repeat protein [Chitinophagaceae bacterium]
MNKAAKITVFCLAVLSIITSCGDHDESSPYSEILSKAPFAGLTDSIRIQPDDAELYYRRALLLNDNNFPEPALADYRKAWSLKKDEYYALGISTLLLERKPDSAVSFLNEAIKELPNSLSLRLNLARSLNAMNKTDEAIAICMDILKQNPAQVDVLKMTAELLEKKGNHSEGIALLERAYNLVPSDVELNYMLALRYAENKNPKVLSLCDSLIRADSSGERAEPYYYKGIYYSGINEKNKALTFFDEAVKHNYNMLEGYIEKGSILFEMKKYNEALKVFNLLLNISPEYPDSYYWIAKCQQALGQKEEAKLNYQRAYGLDNTFKEAKDSADKLK